MFRRYLAIALLALVAVAASPAGAVEIWQRLPTPQPMPTAERSGFAPVNGIQIYYAVYGKGPPLILLHGGLANSNYWGNQVPVFAKTHRVIVMDSRGHGRSTRDAQPYGYDLMASDVLGLMDFLGIKRAAIVGWSDGGIIGLDIALNHPDRLTRLFAFGANTDPSGVREDLDKNDTFNRFIAGAGKAYKRLSKTPNDYDGFVKAIGVMWESQPNWTPDQLRGITVPTAIADGEHDEAIKRTHTEEMARLIPGAKLIILPGVSHFAMLQNPKLFNAAVLGFIDGK
ncbi:MAG: Alpha/beta hydrolase [Rhodospirillales bacterium]|jgi:pimeloyl-ACP methyl ester carboxylesterase|nr:Alpha/beta hydrolase [Rhodospirillales bacterium]